MKSFISRALAVSSLFFSFILMPLATQAQVTDSESFDGIFPPTGWVNNGVGSLWVQRTNGTFPTCTPHSGPAMARFSARNQAPGTQEVFISPVVDYSGNVGGANPTFTLWVYRDGTSTAGDSVTIFTNTTNSLTGATRIGAVARSRFFILPVNELTEGWYEYTFNVPSTAIADTNYFLLNGTSLDGANIYIDDVSWVAYPELCTGAPVAGTISADQSVICGGPGDANLTLIGATSNFSGLSYHWQSAPTDTGPWTDFGTSDVTANTGTLSVSTYFRCYLDCSGSGLSDTTAVVLIQVNLNPPPVIAVAPGNLITYCTGYAPLTIVASGAATYTWTPNIAINNGVGDTALAAPVATTNYTIVGTDSAGCTGSAIITVNVRNTPNVNATTNNDTICEGASTNLQASIIGPGFGIQYQWNPGSVNGQNITVSPVATTPYVVSATSTQSGCVGLDTVLITVIPAPVVSFAFSAINQIVTFTDTSPVAVWWLWDFGDGVTSTQQNPIHIYGAIGTYTVTLTISDGTCASITTQTVVISQVGLPQLSDNVSFNLFPNPANDEVTVEFVLAEKTVSLEVINALGQMVLNDLLTPMEGTHYKTSLGLKNIAKGVYTLKITTGDASVIRQLVKN